MGAIPAGFEAEDSMLLIGGRRADSLVAEAGDTPLFVYDLDRVTAQVRRFRAACPGVGLHYAIKANTYASILSHISKLVDGLDVASAGEMAAALESGTDSGEISFAGPGKRDD
ncbi:MAG: pyridoxal-dependent decarboxylase, exosortase A system-associated, partial [Allosphingosinicella sp.]